MTNTVHEIYMKNDKWCQAAANNDEKYDDNNAYVYCIQYNNNDTYNDQIYHSVRLQKSEDCYNINFCTI